MNKPIQKQTPHKDIVKIPNTKYIILPDNTVARLLTPRTVHGTTYFNLFINGEYKATQVEKLREINVTSKETGCNDSENVQK